MCRSLHPAKLPRPLKNNWNQILQGMDVIFRLIRLEEVRTPRGLVFHDLLLSSCWFFVEGMLPITVKSYGVLFSYSNIGALE